MSKPDLPQVLIVLVWGMFVYWNWTSLIQWAIGLAGVFVTLYLYDTYLK